jgi:hypothetical protein
MSTIPNATLSAYTWTGSYDLTEANFAYKFAGIVTPVPDDNIEDDIIFGATGIASFSSEPTYPSGATNNNIYEQAPANYTQTSLTKSNIPGTALDAEAKLLKVTVQASLADTDAGEPLENTVLNSLDYMYDALANIDNIVAQPTAEMDGAEYRLIQTTVKDTGANNAQLPDILYNQIINPLYADSGINYEQVYRALVSRALITFTNAGTELTDATAAGYNLGNATTLTPTTVPSSVLSITNTDPASGNYKKTINVYMYGDEGKTFGWKYVMNVYVVNVA